MDGKMLTHTDGGMSNGVNEKHSLIKSDGKCGLLKIMASISEDAICERSGFEFGFRVYALPPPPIPPPASLLLRFKQSCNSRCEWEGGVEGGVLTTAWHSVWGPRAGRQMPSPALCRVVVWCRWGVGAESEEWQEHVGAGVGVWSWGSSCRWGVRARPHCNEARPIRATGAESVRCRIANAPPAARLFVFIEHVSEMNALSQSTAHCKADSCSNV